MNKNNGIWYNYKTGEYGPRPEDLSDALPQHEAAQGMYRIYVAMGLSPEHAAINTLSRCIGEPAPFEPTTKETT